MADPRVIKNRIGDRHGCWTVVGYVGRKPNSTHKLWLCRCDCGNEKTVTSGCLTGGVSRSCGCLQRELASKTHLKHGRCRSPEYHSWSGMWSRCTNPSNKDYHRWGGRGIRVCRRWKSFSSFLADMGQKPGSKYSLDRINNLGNYKPSNCRWAVPKTQARNKRDTIYLTIKGKRRALVEWAEISSVPYYQIHRRIRKGWSADRAVFAPLRADHRRNKK